MGVEKAGSVNMSPLPTAALPSSSHHQFPLVHAPLCFASVFFLFYNLSSCDLPSMMSKTVPFLSSCLLSVLSFLSLAAPRAFSCAGVTVPIFSSWHFSGSEKCILCFSYLTLHSPWDLTVLGFLAYSVSTFSRILKFQTLWLFCLFTCRAKELWVDFRRKAPSLFLSPAVPNSLTDAPFRW